jgi:2-polyprenyl-6-methoxyphenol hydroxylase-like FAD-dependent oxidoreductase
VNALTPGTSGHDHVRTDVLIVGAGPAGLALATSLARSGVKALLVDRLASGQNTSRAAVVHAHTIEVLDRIGVGDELVARGLWLQRFTIRDRGRRLLGLRFDGLPSRRAGLLMLPQDVTERVLEGALRAAGGAVQRGCTVTSLVEGRDGVTATVVSDDGTHTVTAGHVVGADGMHSVVRQAAGIGFTGAAYEESFVLADVHMDWPPGDQEVQLYFSPDGLLVVAPLPGGGYRIVATVAEAPPQPSVADVQALLDTRGPEQVRGRVRQVVWGSRFRVHHRVADHYRRGRFLLAGDAAHVHSPAGGQGMNTGLVDACVLGELLTDVLTGRRDESWLDRYEVLRRPAAVEVLALSGGLTRMALARGRLQRLVRNLRLRLMDKLPFARHRLAMNLSGLARRAAARVT